MGGANEYPARGPADAQVPHNGFADLLRCTERQHLLRADRSPVREPLASQSVDFGKIRPTQLEPYQTPVAATRATNFRVVLESYPRFPVSSGYFP